MYDPYLDRLVGEIRSRGMITPGLMYEDPCGLDDLPGKGIIAKGLIYYIEDDPKGTIFDNYDTAYQSRRRRKLTGRIQYT